MRITKLDLIDKFQCIADKCEKTCCSGWQIVIDDNTLEKYEDTDSNVKSELDRCVDYDEGVFYQDDERNCAFLRKDGLCDLILKGGEEMLCDTCRLYPRHVEEYEGVREWSVSYSCPEAARMLVNLEAPISFTTSEDDEPEPFEDDYEDFDIFLMTQLEEVREKVYGIATDDSLDIYSRMGFILELSKKLQKCYDEDEVFTMGETADSFIAEGFKPEYLKEIKAMQSDGLSLLDELEELEEDWPCVKNLLDAFSEKALEDFSEAVGRKKHTLILENLLLSMLYTYFNGSVYNGMIYGYTAYAIFAVVIVDALCAVEMSIEKDANALEIFTRVLYSYSRETEHSDDNINTILEFFDSKC